MISAAPAAFGWRRVVQRDASWRLIAICRQHIIRILRWVAALLHLVDGTPNVVKSKFVELSMEKLLHPRQEAAQLLSVSLRKVDLLIASKALKTVRVGRRNLVAHSELERFARTGTSGKSKSA